MKQLLEIDETTFGRESLRGVGKYKQRRAVRAVLLDDQGRVYLMQLDKRNAHKLPGGGVNEGEDLMDALARELMEEVGVKCEVLAEIGQVVEYRDVKMMEQYSYSYLVRQVGVKGPNSLEPDELADGMHEILAENIEQAIALVESSDSSDVEVQYMALRDATILRAAKSLIDQLDS